MPRTLGISTIFGALVFVTVLTAQPPAGEEFPANTVTTTDQIRPDVAVAPAGDFLVVWESFASAGDDMSGSSIQLRRFSADGTPLAPELQVNTTTASSQGEPAVARTGDGGFVVVWESYASAGTDTSYHSIQGQRFDSAGTAIGSEFQVNTTTTDYQRRPAVTATTDGGFVVAWQSSASAGDDASSYSIQAQRFASDGTPAGGELEVNTTTTGAQIVPALTDAGAGFLVVWQNGFTDVRGQRFASDGTPVGAELVITPSTALAPDVDADADGDFVVAWETNTGGSYEITARRFALDGTPAGSDFQVNTATTGDQTRPAVSMAGTGDFVVAWQSTDGGGTDADGEAIRAQRFASDGLEVGNEFQVNSRTTGDQESPALGHDADGDFVVLWQGPDDAGVDTEVFGQRYAEALMSGDTDLGVIQADAPDPVLVGSALTVTVTVENLGPNPAAGVTVVATLPAGVTFVSVGGQDWSCGETVGVVTCDRGPELGVGPAPDIAIELEAPAETGTITHHAAVSHDGADPAPGNDEHFEDTTVAAATADLALTKSDSADPVDAGAAFTYTIDITNAGPVAAGALTLVDTMPPEAAILSVSGLAWDCLSTADGFTCDRPAGLGVGSTTTVTVEVAAPATDNEIVLSNTASVTSTTPDPATGDNTDTETTTVSGVMEGAELSVLLTDAPDPVILGFPLTYEIDVANAGPAVATSVEVVLTPPAFSSFVAASGAGWSCAEGQAGLVTCNRSSLLSGAAPTIIVKTLASPIPELSQARVDVTASQSDSNPGDNTAFATTEVLDAVFADGFESGGFDNWTLKVP